MVNANGKIHTWTTAQVKSVMEKMGFAIPSKVTDGDMAYTANMAYADFTPTCLRTMRPAFDMRIWSPMIPTVTRVCRSADGQPMLSVNRLS